ncbi:MAG: peptidylprolyl isomerase [Fibrobacter sp.]|nr:peptidylprolyl isomerase [Fibrobacter sp.]
MKTVQDKLKVSIAYTLKERTGRILEEVPPSHPFTYIHGFSNIIPGLEDAMWGRHLNEFFSVDIPCILGYGPYREDMILEVPKAELSDIGEIWLGMELEMTQDDDIREFQLPDNAEDFVKGLNLDGDDEQDDDEGESDGIYIIKEIKKDTVIVDGNHPFAGKDLTFDVHIVAIEEPSFTELESGFPDKVEGEFDDFEDDADTFGEDFGHNPDNFNRRWR